VHRRLRRDVLARMLVFDVLSTLDKIAATINADESLSLDAKTALIELMTKAYDDMIDSLELCELTN
jgi:hypothetical protein